MPQVKCSNPQDHSPLQMPATNPGCHLQFPSVCVLPIYYQSFPQTSTCFLNSINVLEWLTELKKIYFLNRLLFITKGC